MRPLREAIPREDDDFDPTPLPVDAPPPSSEQRVAIPEPRAHRTLSGERPRIASAVSGEWPAVAAPPAAVPPNEIVVAARRAVSFATANAPDPHVILVRLALRTGLGLDAIMHLDRLGSQGLALLETAIEDMFGIDRGRLRESRATSPAPGGHG